VISVGTVLAAAGDAALYLTTDHGGSVAWLFPGLVLLGAGQGLCITPLTTTVLSHAGPATAGSVSGALSTAQQVGNSIGVAVTGVLFFGALGHGYSLAFERSVLQMGALLLVVAALTRLMPGRQETARRRPRPLLRRREHAVQSSDALGGGADVKHDHPGVRLHRPGGPRTALGLHGDEGAQFFLGAALGAEADAQAIRGFGAFGHGPGDELLPALALGRQLGRGEGAGDRSGPRHDVPPDRGIGYSQVHC
jgi:MFS family permease